MTDVEPGSFADEVGIQQGDVILEFNHQPVLTLSQFLALQRQVEPGSDVVFWLKRRAGNDWIGLYVGGSLPQ